MPRGLRGLPSRRWVAPVLLVILTLAFLWPVCGHEFTTWDDYPNVAQNPRLNPPSIDGVLYFWTHAPMSMYIPLTYTLWSAIAAVARMPDPDPAGIWLNPYLFHSANLLVHLIAALLAYRLLRLLIGGVWPACAGALLFALHPVQVEAVAWVAGMKDVLSGALSLAALVQYVQFRAEAKAPIDNRQPRGAQNHSHPAAARWHYALATFFFVLAMLAKPQAMTLPLAAAAIDRWMLGRRWRQIARAVVPWLALAVPVVVIAGIAQQGASPVAVGPLWVRPLLALHALAFYLDKLVFPARLCILYNQAPSTIIYNHWLYFTWIVPAAVAVGLWLLRHRAPWLLASAGIFLAGVLPVLGLKTFYFEVYTLVADHYLYTAMLGPALALAGALRALHDADPMRISSFGGARAIGGICAACLIALGVRSAFQATTWRNTQTLFKHVLKVNPNSYVACNSLAALYTSPATLNVRMAVFYTQRSLMLEPGQVEGYVELNNLAAILARQGRLLQALRMCDEAIRRHHDFSDAHLNKATILANLHRLPEALAEIAEAVRLNPANVRARVNYGVLLARSGKRDQAIEQVREALRINPNFAPAQAAMRAMKNEK